MCRLGAIANCDPHVYSLRELWWMAEAADQAAWARTFAIVAQLYNINRGSDSESINILDYYPWQDKQKKVKNDTARSDQDERVVEDFFTARQKARKPKKPAS